MRIVGILLALAGWAGWHWWSVATALDRKLDAMKGHEAVPGCCGKRLLHVAPAHADRFPT